MAKHHLDCTTIYLPPPLHTSVVDLHTFPCFIPSTVGSLYVSIPSPHPPSHSTSGLHTVAHCSHFIDACHAYLYILWTCFCTAVCISSLYRFDGKILSFRDILTPVTPPRLMGLLLRIVCMPFITVSISHWLRFAVCFLRPKGKRCVESKRIYFQLSCSWSLVQAR